MPVDFKYTSKGLTVSFSIIGNIPQGFSPYWVFGDGEYSTDTAPWHTYPKSDFYPVTLKIVDNLYQAIDSITYQIGVSGIVKTTLSDSIYDLIDTYIPSEVGKLSYKDKQFYIRKWQLYLQPLVNHFIPVEEYANEMYYEALENQLIMELSAYDFMVTEISNMLKIIGAKAAGYSSNNNSSTTSPGTSGGSIKKITTGPTEVEYFDSGSSISDELSSLTKFLQSDGVIDTIKQNICMLSARLEIYLPICNSLPSKKVVPQVVNRREPGFIKGPDPIEITS